MTSKKLGGLIMKLVYTVHKLLFFKKTDMCLPLPLRLEKTFAHEDKYQKIFLNTSADN